MLSFFKKKNQQKAPAAEPTPLLTGGDVVPTGVNHSMIPIEYLGIVKHNWDEGNKLYTNQIILQNPTKCQ